MIIMSFLMDVLCKLSYLFVTSHDFLLFLRFLDVSQANQTYGMFECPDTTLANLVSSLPNLTSLDISGTNLSGDGTFDEYRDSDDVNLHFLHLL